MVVDNNTNKLQQLIAKSLKHLFENSNDYVHTLIQEKYTELIRKEQVHICVWINLTLTNIN